MIEASRTRIPLLQVLTKVCAIVGGVFTVLGALDLLLYRAINVFSGKNK